MQSWVESAFAPTGRIVNRKSSHAGRADHHPVELSAAIMSNRKALEREFLQLCQARGPAWIESVIRPLRLPGNCVSAKDIPLDALRAIIRLFGRTTDARNGVSVI